MPRGRQKRYEACRLLRSKLANGPAPEDEIIDAAIRAGIPKSDLLDASDDLDLICCRGHWRLPE